MEHGGCDIYIENVLLAFESDLSGKRVGWKTGGYRIESLKE